MISPLSKAKKPSDRISSQRAQKNTRYHLWFGISSQNMPSQRPTTLSAISGGPVLPYYIFQAGHSGRYFRDVSHCLAPTGSSLREKESLTSSHHSVAHTLAKKYPFFKGKPGQIPHKQQAFFHQRKGPLLSVPVERRIHVTYASEKGFGPPPLPSRPVFHQPGQRAQ